MNYRNKSGKYSTAPAPKKHRGMPIWAVVLLDAVLVGMILLVFASFHHVLPKYIAEREMLKQIENATEPPVTQPVETEPPATEAPSHEEVETEPPTEPDPRTPWQIKFQDKFTDEVVVTDHSYSSQEVSVTFSTVTTKMDDRKVVYYVADIYIAGIENFKTYIAYDNFKYFMEEEPFSMARKTNSIVAIDGDYCTVQKTGFVVRNSNVYLSDLANGICVLFPDGTMETYEKDTYVIDDILAREPVHVWSFGPSLLDENGKAIEEFQLSNAIAGRHPRGAVGYYEPGHYCFVLVDGRQDGYSNGMSIQNLAKVFEELGCKVAYNMDGGRSAVMLFGDKYYNKPYLNGRNLGDILYIAESGLYTHAVENIATEEAVG